MRVSRALGVLAVVLAAWVSAGAQQIALTWDDLPAHGPLPAGETRVGIGKRLLDVMKAEHIPSVYGFVIGASIDHEPASEPMIKDWRAAGLQLGNHTWSHMNLNAASLEDWEADVLKNERVLEKYAPGSDWKWLRPPYSGEGDTPNKRDAARRFLAEHHYKIAAVTMTFSDYLWNAPYARCVATNDQAAIAQLESSYLNAAARDADYRRAMAKALFGHDIPYVLVVHVGAFDARMLPRLLKMYREKGFSFITLEEAEKDPFYRSSVDPSLPAQPDTLEGAMAAKGRRAPESLRMTVDLDGMCK